MGGKSEQERTHSRTLQGKGPVDPFPAPMETAVGRRPCSLSPSRCHQTLTHHTTGSTHSHSGTHAAIYGQRHMESVTQK